MGTDHLRALADLDILERAVGAHDGVTKSRSTVGRHVKTGVHNSFVAPVTIGDGATTGAGSVIRRDVPPGALAVSSGPQRNLERWALSKRAGTPQADAAEAALDRVEESD